jgi:hypothetical protein
VLADRYADDHEVRARFRREALATARLAANSSIVTIFDVGEHRGAADDRDVIPRGRLP